MTLALRPPFPPMEALSVDEIPTGDDWQYEPKWDGFRCLVFRDGGKVELQSKSGQPLTRYFPELVDAARGLKAKKFVIDGEIVVPSDGAFSFDALLQRIHPAQSRVQKLAVETPSLLIAFDLLLADDGKKLVDLPLQERRRALEAFAQKNFKDHRIRLSPATTKLGDAKGWLARVGSTLDGIIAKRRDLPYRAARPHRHAEDQELPQRRLRGRRLPLQRGQAGGRLPAARSLRRRGSAASRRLHLDHQARRTSPRSPPNWRS